MTAKVSPNYSKANTLKVLKNFNKPTNRKTNLHPTIKSNFKEEGIDILNP